MFCRSLKIEKYAVLIDDFFVNTTDLFLCEFPVIIVYTYIVVTVVAFRKFSYNNSYAKVD